MKNINTKLFTKTSLSFLLILQLKFSQGFVSSIIEISICSFSRFISLRLLSFTWFFYLSLIFSIPFTLFPSTRSLSFGSIYIFISCYRLSRNKIQEVFNGFLFSFFEFFKFYWFQSKSYICWAKIIFFFRITFFMNMFSKTNTARL